MGDSVIISGSPPSLLFLFLLPLAKCDEITFFVNIPLQTENLKLTEVHIEGIGDGLGAET